MIFISPFCFYINSSLNIIYQIFVSLLLFVLNNRVHTHLFIIRKNDLNYWLYSTLWKTCMLISMMDNGLSYILHVCNSCRTEIEMAFLLIRIIIIGLAYYNFKVTIKYKLYKYVSNVNVIQNFIWILMNADKYIDSINKKLNRFKIKSLNFNCCIICLESRNYNIVRLACGHEFHKNCVKRWFYRCKNKSNEISCPNCRSLFF